MHFAVMQNRRRKDAAMNKARTLWFWLAIWFFATLAIIAWNVIGSKMSDDPSAMAWIGWLPFLWPIMAIQALMFVVPAWIVFKVADWLIQRKERKDG